MGISINEFIAGEDISSENIAAKSEKNIIGIATSSKKNQNFLKKIIAVLIVIATVTAGALSTILYLKFAPKDVVSALDENSIEMQTAKLISSDNSPSALLYKYENSVNCKGMNFYLQKYESSKLISNERVMGISYEDISPSKEGMIAVVPNHKSFTVDIIVSNENGKYAVHVPIMEGVANRNSYLIGKSAIKKSKKIDYGKQQGFAALVYGKEGIQSVNFDDLNTSEDELRNDYAYYFSFEFIK